MRAVKYYLLGFLLSPLGLLSILASDAGEPLDDQSDNIEEVIVKPRVSNVRYSANVSSHELLSHATDVLNMFPNLAFDNSIGQIRSRGAEASHLGIQVDGYDISDPVSEFNFASLSCVGIASISFNPTPASGSIAGVLNLRSALEQTRTLTLASGSAGNLLQFSLGREGHALSLSNRHWNGVDVRNDGDVDSLEQRVFHYHYRANNQWETTIRIGQSIQEYDPGVAKLAQGLVGVTGTVLGRIVVKGSTSVNRAEWQESFVSNSYGSRTKLMVLVPFNDIFSLETVKTYDVNKSYVWGEAVRKPINTSIVKFTYRQNLNQLSWKGSLQVIDSSQDSAIVSTNLHTSWLIPKFFATTSRLKLFIEIDDNTVVFPSMIDRYGWGQAWLPNPDVKPELGSGIDVGLHVDSSYGQLQLTRFRNRLRDKISFGRNISENQDYGRNRGVELLWQIRWSTQLSTQLSYSYLDSETRQSEAHPFVQTQRRPANILTGSINFASARSNTEVQLRRVDESIDACWRGCQTLAPHLLVNASHLRILGRRFTISAQIYNLLDESYSLVYGYNTPGRLSTLGLQMTF